jgi:hypothetical protein
MINRLPKEYSAGDPLATGTGSSNEGRIPGLAPAGEPFQQRILSAAANSVGTHPVASLGVAFVVGIVLGKLVKR